MQGIDVSSHDKWPFKTSTETCYKDSGFVIVKVTEGRSYLNPYWEKACKRALTDNKLIGVYHYASGADPVLEANYFYSKASKYKGIAVPCLDWEKKNNRLWGDATWCRKFAKRTKELWGVWPMIYIQASAIAQAATCYPDCPLWVTGYPYDKASWSIPKFIYDIKPWKKYAVWQFTSGHDTTDRNITDLTREEWQKMAKTKKTPLEIAVGEIGTKEQPADSNKVKYNTWFYGKKVSGSAYPWCAVFVAWCFDQAGDTSIAGVPNKAYCPSYVTWAKRHGYWTSKPKKGALVLYDWNHDGVADHIGIVEKVIDSKTIHAIEGNTAIGDDSNGGEVMRRVRKTSTVLGYIDFTAEKEAKPAGDKYKITASPWLRVRDKRSTIKGNVVGTLTKGTVVELTALKKNKVGNTWAQIASGKYKGKYIAVIFKGNRYAVKQ